MKNRLSQEKSPYLLQHSENPVDWYPWSEEAFLNAKHLNRPIFLSIGYSACHWCHVMEKESFADPNIAKMMNDTFINIKVDREERPDIDAVYMQVCNMLTGGGGWPLTIIMNSDKVPFLAGTYFPKENRMGKVGIKELINRVSKVWNEKNDLIKNTSAAVLQKLKIEIPENYGSVLTEDIFHQTYHLLMTSYDSINGGFGDIPKFPTPHNLLFLLRYYKKYGEKFALEMVTNTLDKMRLGGVYDQLGGGFHRYSTDAEWKTPHFEKMLYDQALMIQIYSEAFQITNEELYKNTVEEIINYTCKKLSTTNSAFFSSVDADSEGKEGFFYLWKIEEIQKDFSDNELNFLIDLFNLSESGNFKDINTDGNGYNNLFCKTNIEEIKETYNISPENYKSILNRLYTIRELRSHPTIDNKILADWNGLMVAALAKAGIIFNNETYIQKAQDAADFIIKKMLLDGELLHRFNDGNSAVPGMIDDYSFFTYGLIELYFASLKPEYLKYAVQLTDYLVEHFFDENSGCFYMTSDKCEPILIHKKEFYDGAVPSGQSYALLNLLKLCDISDRRIYDTLASKIFDYLAGIIDEMPLGFVNIISSYFYAFHSDIQIIIADENKQINKNALFEKINYTYNPEKIILYAPIDKKDDEIFNIASFLKKYKTINGKTTYHLCHNFICNYPETDISKLRF